WAMIGGSDGHPEGSRRRLRLAEPRRPSASEDRPLLVLKSWNVTEPTHRSSRLSSWSLACLVLGYAVAEAVAGAPNSPLVPELPPGVRPPSWTVRWGDLLGLDRVGRAGLTSISLVVIAVVAGAFVLLVRESWRRRVRLTPIVIAGGLSLALSVAGPLLLSRDVYSYAAYGRMFALHGTNPYVAPPSAFPGDPFTSVVS